MHRVLAAVAVSALLAACAKPAAPDTDKPVEPQSAARHDDLKRAIDQPLAKAKSAQSALDAAQASQNAAIEAAADGDPQTN